MTARLEYITLLDALEGSTIPTDREFARTLRSLRDREAVLDCVTAAMTVNARGSWSWRLGWVVWRLIGGSEVAA